MSWKPFASVATLTVALIAATAAAASAPELAWTATVGGRDARPAGVAFDADGNLLVVATVPVRGNRRDLQLTKRSPAGRLLWRRTLGGDRNDEGLAVIAGHDGTIYVTGSTESERVEGQPRRGQRDLLVAAYSPTGTLRWVRRWGDCNTSAGVALAPVRGGIAVVADHTGSDIPCPGETAAWYAPHGGWVLRFDRLGNLRWETPVRFADQVDTEITAIANDGNDALFVAGWTVSWRGNRQRVAAARLAPGGRVTWANEAVVSGVGSATGVDVLKGRVFIAGQRFERPRAGLRPAAFLTELNAGSGAAMWTKDLERAGIERTIAGMVPGGDDTLLIAGSEWPAPNRTRKSRGWLAAVTPGGEVDWSAEFGEAGTVHTGLAAGARGAIAVASVQYDPARTLVSVYR